MQISLLFLVQTIRIQSIQHYRVIYDSRIHKVCHSKHLIITNMKLTFCRQLGLYHTCQSTHCIDFQECEVASLTPSFLARLHLLTKYASHENLPAPRLPAIVYLRLVFIYLYLN